MASSVREDSRTTITPPPPTRRRIGFRREDDLPVVEREKRHEIAQRLRAPEDDERARIIASIDHNRRTRRKLQRAVMAMFYGNVGVLAALVIFVGGAGVQSTAALLTLVARLAAMAGMYLLLMQLLLVGRLPWLDRLYGMDRLTRWHKHNGHASFTLIVVHVVFVLIGRAMLSGVGVMAMGMSFWDYRFMPEAIGGLVMICLCIATSIRLARTRLGRERWYSVHLLAYVGVILSFGHELYGPDFAGHFLAQAYLMALYLATFGLIATFRIAVPVYRTFRHQLRVVELVQEANDVTSIYLEGVDLWDLNIQPGQFFYWRFLTKSDWMETHPYSISLMPEHHRLRITVKHLGDASSRVRDLRIGTWVAFEGPYGGFTPDSRTRVRTLLIAAGVGITPIRTLLEGMASAPGDMTVIYRVSSRRDLVLAHELKQLAHERQARIKVVVGPRNSFPRNRQPLSARHLRDVVPDIRQRDVYVCASVPVTDFVFKSLEALDVDPKQIHAERFVF